MRRSSEELQKNQLGQAVGRQQKVAQDLEDLLNTRCRCALLPEGIKELETSVVNYGLPDFSGVKMTGSVERKKLIRRFRS